MKKIYLWCLVSCSMAVHAAQVEQQQLTPSLNEAAQDGSTGWTTETVVDSKNNVTEFLAKYKDINSGISISYVIPMDDNRMSFYFSFGDNYDSCKVENIRFEFLKNKFEDIKTQKEMGAVWPSDRKYYSFGSDIKSDSLGNYFFNVNPIDFDQSMKTNENIKIIYFNRPEILIPYDGAVVKIDKAQKACQSYLNQVKENEIANRAKAEALAKVKRAQESLELEKRHKELQRRLDAQARKPGVQIGMTAKQVIQNTRWGAPLKINTTVTKFGTSEQWVYWGNNFLYFENGRLVAIQRF